MKFRVHYAATTRDGGLVMDRSAYFRTEREARQFINSRANGGVTFRLYEIVSMRDSGADTLVVESSWPVCMVA